MRMTDEFYENRYVVRFSEIGQDKRLNYGRLTEYAQNIAMDHSGFVGYDSDFFNEKNEAWAILFYHFKIFDMPMENETVVLRTWDRQLKRSQAHRQITMSSEDGKLYVDIYVRFVYLDTETRRPKKLDPVFMEKYYFPKEAGFEDEKAPVTFPLPEGEPMEEGLFKVKRRDIDPSGHTNSAVYLPMAVDYVPDEIFYNKQLEDIKIMYKHEGFLGDDVRCRVYEGPVREDGKVEMTATFTDQEDDDILYAAVKMVWA